MKKNLLFLTAVLFTFQSFSQTCIAPTNLSSYSSLSSQIVSWNPGSDESHWLLQYSISNDTSFLNARTVDISSNPYTISDLNPMTTYNVRVRAICSASDSSAWSNNHSFTTACITISSLPWRDSFDTYGTGFTVFPVCWTRIFNPLESVACIDYINYSPPGSLSFRSNPNAYTYVISPKFDTSIHINNLRAKFKLRTEYATNKLVVGVMTNPNDTSTFIQIQELTLNDINTWVDCEVFFNSYTGTGQYIAFNSYDDILNFVYLDDLEISLLPSCIRPTNLKISNITPTSVKTSWTSNGNETQWTIQYKPYSDTSWTNAVSVNNISSNPYQLTGLPNLTALDIRIKAVCSSSDESEWSYFDSPVYGNNFDLSYGNFVGWKGYQGRNLSTLASTLIFAPWTSVINQTNYNTIEFPSFFINSDTNLCDSVITSLKKIPSGYTHSTRINYKANQTSGYGNANMLTYDLHIDPTNYLTTLNYALIFSRPQAQGYINPIFQIEVLKLGNASDPNIENGRIDSSAFLEIVGSYTVPADWNLKEPISGNLQIVWKPWSQMSLDLSDYIGQKVRIKILLAKSNTSYGWAYGYFAGRSEGFEPGTCYPPIGTIVEDIKSTSATINFSSNNTISSEWELLYREIGSTIWNNILIDTSHYILNNLSPDADYEAMLLTLCSDSTYSDSSLVFTFRTQTLNIDSLFNNETAYLCGKYVYDDGGEVNNHGSNYNYTFTLCPTRRTNEIIASQRASVYFEEFNLGQGDVMKAYSGRSINPQSQLSIGIVNNFTGNYLQNKTLVSNLVDTSGCITFNIITDASGEGTGFKAKVECFDRCQYPIAALDTFFIKYDALGTCPII